MREPYGERLLGRPGRQETPHGPPREPSSSRRNQKPGAASPGAGRQLEAVYRGLGETVQKLHGWHAVLLSGNADLERAVALKPIISPRLWNGPLETRLLVYRVP